MKLYVRASEYEGTDILTKTVYRYFRMSISDKRKYQSDSYDTVKYNVCVDNKCFGGFGWVSRPTYSDDLFFLHYFDNSGNLHQMGIYSDDILVLEKR